MKAEEIWPASEIAKDREKANGSKGDLESDQFLSKSESESTWRSALNPQSAPPVDHEREPEPGHAMWYSTQVICDMFLTRS